MSSASITGHKATRIDLFSLATPQMRAFHLSWLAFFVCFFAWFAIAPLMPVIKGEFHLTKPQVANIAIAAVFITILVRLVIGPLCERYGPRRTYVGLLVLGAVPVIGIAFATSYTTFLIFRLAIGAIGASFVITQFHTSSMFAPNVVGTANATVGGWGNAGGGVTQTVMPLLFALLVGLGLGHGLGWRVSMVVPGVLMLIVAALYWRYTQDTPDGDLVDLRRRGIVADTGKKGGLDVFLAALGNYRVWMLAICYGASFGVELFIHGMAATYYVERFRFTLADAGFAAGSFGLLALFARALGGFASDRVARRHGLSGRTALLFALLLAEGVFLVVFSLMGVPGIAIAAMLAFGLFTHMSCGAIYAIVPFVDRRALGGVTGIVGAGGNVGAVAAGFLLKGYGGDVALTLEVLGWCVIGAAFCAAAVRFPLAHRETEQRLYDEAINERSRAVTGSGVHSAA